MAISEAFKTPEIANLIEGNINSHSNAQQATQWQELHFSGFLVRLANGVVK